MFVRMVQKPSGSIDGLELCHYKLGHIYDMDAALAEYLIVEGFAVAEMRHANRSHRVRSTDRRISAT